MGDVLSRRTVDATPAHRAAVSEVFVTDLRRTSATQFLAGARLPWGHHYYGDHTTRPPRLDPLFVAAAGRQAAMHGAHQFLEIPSGSSYAVHDLALHLTDDTRPATTPETGEPQILTRYPAIRQRVGTTRRFHVTQEFRLSGQRIGTGGMDVSVLSAKAYRDLRYLQRRTPAPTTADVDPPFGLPVPPELVDRIRVANVVLADAELGHRSAVALLRPDFANPTLFDHPYDHHPTMVLLEAARQGALLAGGGRVLGLSARFRRFAELDAPVWVAANVSARGRVAVRFTQNGMVVATAECAIVPA